jgi:hypothetical protein
MWVLDKLALAAFMWFLEQIHTVMEAVPPELEILEGI